MRELKFRAWDKKRKKMFVAQSINRSGCATVLLKNQDILILPKKQIEIMQYTGLKDKNGKEIYEGDIVNIQGIKYYVDFEFGGFWFNNDNRKWKANRPFTHFQEINDAEVIGNIHENPELLEDE